MFEHSLEDARSKGWEPWDRPIVAGRDLRPWQAPKTKALLWCYDENLDILPDAPEPLRAHFARHQSALQARSDWREGTPLWTLYRLTEGLQQPKVVWRDMGPHLQATQLDASTLPLNTAYYIPCADSLRAWALCAWLNSAPVRSYAHALAERARGRAQGACIR